MKYAVVYEQTPRNWAAYVPDLPGCVATGPTREEVERLITQGIRFHIEGMGESGEAIPPPTRPSVSWKSDPAPARFLPADGNVGT